MFTISQTRSFEAAHYLTAKDGPDHYKTIHGHSFVVTVHCARSVMGDNAWVMDLGKLDAGLGAVLALLDHKVLNDIEGLETSTFENIMLWIYKALKAEGITASKIEIARPTLGQAGTYIPE